MECRSPYIKIYPPMGTNFKTDGNFGTSNWQIDNWAAMLFGLLHPNDYEGRQVTHCIELLLTTSHSVLNTRAVVKPGNKELKKSL
ncbi:hypothetical protein TNCV_4994741 [Trichonephila clavipes]|nr:hypothetical protein TNCV_4994741 [Trichonephila clavipes]